MEKLTKELRLKFAFMFLISNLATFMIASSSAPEMNSIKTPLQEKVTRPNYIELALPVQIRAKLMTNRPYVLTDAKRSLYAPYIFFISKQDLGTLSEYPDSMELNQEKLILSIPKSLASKLLDKNDLLLIPQIEKKLIHQNKKRRTYEINF